MNSTDFEYIIRKLDADSGLVAVDLVGGLFSHGVNDLGETLDMLGETRARDVIINCRKLDFISSSGIGLLMQTHNKYCKSDKRLWVVELCPEVKVIFEHLALNAVLRVLPAEADALADISATGQD